jgi:predicted TPR repeat methyltransferase
VHLHLAKGFAVKMSARCRKDLAVRQVVDGVDFDPRRDTPESMKVRERDLQLGRAYAENERLSAFYERHLVDFCQYRAPAIVADVVAPMAAAGSRWLEVGAGTGLVGKELEGRGARLELVALDISEAMLNRIESPLYVARVQADCRDPLPWEPACFAGAVACGLLEHLDVPNPLFRELARVLCPGAPLVITFPVAHAGGDTERTSALASHDCAEVRHDLNAAGFVCVSTREFPAYRDGSAGWVMYALIHAERESAVG